MANDFSGDANVQGLWTFEDYTVDTDPVADTSGNGNTLTNTQFGGAHPSAETVNVREGSISADYLTTGLGGFSRIYANLNADFPGKTGKDTFTVCFWVRGNNITGANGFMVSMTDDGNRVWATAYGTVAADRRFNLQIGEPGGAASEVLVLDTLNLVQGDWYHYAATFDGPTKAYRIRVYDEDSDTVFETTGNSAQSINIESCTFRIFGIWTAGFSVDGTLDEVVVWDRVLTADEIDQVRQGIFEVSVGGRQLVSNGGAINSKLLVGRVA